MEQRDNYIKKDERLNKIKPERLKEMIREQSAILEKDKSLALATLAEMLPDREDRITAVELANAIANADDVLSAEEISVLKTIEIVLLKDVFNFPPDNENKKDEQPKVSKQDEKIASVKQEDKSISAKKDQKPVDSKKEPVDFKKDEQPVGVKKEIEKK